MEKVALIELNENALKLTIYRVNGSKSEICLSQNNSFVVGKEIDADELLSPKTKNDILNMLKIYRKLIESYGVATIYAVTTNVIMRARNYRGFLDEIYNNTGINFSILSNEEYIKFLFYGVVSSIDSAKGVFIYSGAYQTYIVKYNRRAILDSLVIPYGTYNVGENGKDIDEIKKFMSNKISLGEIIEGIDEETRVVGVGRPFIAIGKIAKKIQRYPLDIDNNYVLSSEIMDKTYDFIKGLDLEKIRKIKGIDFEEADKISNGMAIIKAIYDAINIKEITISTADLRSGLLQANVLSGAQEKFTDLLSNSLENYNEFNKDEFSMNKLVYDMALLLFKQLKVMHKLPRFYVKPLRIASYMYDCGKYIDKEHYSKYSLEKILFSEIKGASHRELLVAGFIAVCQNLDDLSLNDWIKYKDILTDEDLDAVRKLGVIVKLAVSLNASRKPVITDILCDILGDSIIMKTVTEVDASFEILEGMKVAQDYKKVYKKSLQII